MHGFKVKRGHTSATCTHPQDRHNTAATQSNPKGGSKANKRCTPDTCRFKPVDMLNIDIAYNILANSFPHDSGCTNPPDLSSTAFINTDASKSLVTPSTLTSPATSLESISVIQPGGDKMRITHAVDLLLHKLPPNARMANSLPGLINKLSVAVLCDSSCKVFFNATGCKVTFDSKVILQGWRDPKHRLWHVCIVDDGWTTNLKIDDNVSTLPTTAIAHSLYNCNNTQQLTRFYHTYLFLPVDSTLINAIKRGYLKGFPGLTAQRICCHIQINNATKKGHMDQTHQCQHSTQTNSTSTSNATTVLNDKDVLPDHIDEGLTNLVFMVIHNITELVFSNQTSRFPITSNRGHVHLNFFYIYDANFIESIPIKNRTKQEVLRAYQITYKYLSSCRFKARLHKMDNETSKDVKDFIQSRQTSLQYTPLDIHHTNSAKQAICTRKNHFTAGIAILPKSFPIANWCRLTNQCNYTINMLCPCCQNPLLSAFEAMEGSYLLEATTMDPPGTKVLVHLKQTHHRSWSFMPPTVGPSVHH
jgi:hypothetical protein